MDGARLPRLAPADLEPAQAELYQTIVGGPRQQQARFFPVADGDGVLSGPYRAMLLSPAVGAALERTGVAVRYHCALPAVVRELAILTVAVHTDCATEWRAHENLARDSGVPEETIASLKTGKPVLPDETAEVTHAFTSDLLTGNRVPEPVFARATELWSRSGVFELVATIGYYQTIAHINNAFEVGA
ncbi:carboxymuconolactone decarboxylase family protein [Amycolatopsis sp. GM8]|uniref:carboxymuconolactone decarboxylase family protein n=1 Tax=Amycolatopsis sp. GM8 TaxID=2896530 RepID=UPI001F46FCCD|nr:carboxymuconolactone decarboxylase family protein [Amycolatopsis sp. GM8]